MLEYPVNRQSHQRQGVLCDKSINRNDYFYMVQNEKITLAKFVYKPVAQVMVEYLGDVVYPVYNLTISLA